MYQMKAGQKKYCKHHIQCKCSFEVERGESEYLRGSGEGNLFLVQQGLPLTLRTFSCDGFSFRAISLSNTISFTLLSLSLTISSMQQDAADWWQKLLKRRASIKWQDTKRVISRSKNSEGIKFEIMTIDAMTILGEGSAEL